MWADSFLCHVFEFVFINGKSPFSYPYNINMILCGLATTTDTAFVLSPQIASSDALQRNILFSWWSFDFVYLQKTLTSQTWLMLKCCERKTLFHGRKVAQANKAWCVGLRNGYSLHPIRYDSLLMLQFCVGQTCLWVWGFWWKENESNI